MNIMAILLFVVVIVFPFMALNKAHQLGERVEELDRRLNELEKKNKDT